MTTNQQIHLVSRPTGEASADNFKLVETELPDLKDGQVLVRHHFMSLDPYMRGRMNDAKSYAVPQPLNAVMQGGTVGEVLASKNAAYAVGDKVVGFGGWQQFSVVDATVPGVAASTTLYCCQPPKPTTLSPTAYAAFFDATTSPTVPPCITAFSGCGAA